MPTTDMIVPLGLENGRSRSPTIGTSYCFTIVPRVSSRESLKYKASTWAYVALDLLIVAAVLFLQPLIALLWLFLLLYVGMKFAAWRAGRWADARIDRAEEAARSWADNA